MREVVVTMAHFSGERVYSVSDNGRMFKYAAFEDMTEARKECAARKAYYTVKGFDAREVLKFVDIIQA